MICMDETTINVEPIIDDDFDDSDLVQLERTLGDEGLSEFVRYGLPAEYRRPGRHEADGEPLGHRRCFLRSSDEYESLIEVWVLDAHQDHDGYVARQVVTDGCIVFEIDATDTVPGTL